MKRSRTSKSFFLTGLFGTIAIGGSLAGYTPIACSCLSPWEDIAVRVKLPKEYWREATAAKVQAAFQREYKGERISWMTLPPQGDCSMIAKSQVRCTRNR
jgi:hypothetical protein